LLVALGSIATQQANCTEKTMKAITHLLNYVATHPERMIRFKRSDMQLKIATDSSYLSETKSRSHDGGYHYLSNLRPARLILPEDPLPMMNGPVHVHCSIMPMIVSLAAEAETGGAYYNGKDAVPLRIALEEMGHPQPATPIECDNLLLALSMIHFDNVAPKPWTCAFIGSRIDSNKANSNCIGALDPPIRVTTSPSTIHRHTIASCDNNIFILLLQQNTRQRSCSEENSNIP
jgi:hypothetical protein